MAAPRASSFKALRNLQKASHSVPAKRSLHITGVHSSPAPIDPSRANAYLPLSLQDLRNECRQRHLATSGTKHDLINHLARHDSLQSRAYSIAMRRLATEQTKPSLVTQSPAEFTPQREFNTSRVLQSRGDTSTIDFAFLPKLFEGVWGPQPAAIRVPILPHVESDDAEAILEKYPELDSAAGGYQDTTGHDTQMKAEISSIDDAVSSAMSDVHDGHPTELTVEMLTALTETVGKSARQFADSMKSKDEGEIRRLWNEFLDDFLGSSKKP